MPLPPLVDPVLALTEAEHARTARHRALVGFGELAQRRLQASHVLVMGVGGLGSPAILALAAAGVGTITVIDDDVVEHSNLQRQVVHRYRDIGKPKTDSAVRAAQDLNPEVNINPVRTRLTEENALELLESADVVLDGTDTFQTRVAVAAACERLGIPLVWGVVQEFAAQVTIFWSEPPAGLSPILLRDLYPPASVGELPTCAQVGVLGAVCMQVGALMASEAIKLITGIGQPLFGRVAVIDALHGKQTEVTLRPGRVTAVATAADDAEQRLPAIGEVPLEDALQAGAHGVTLIDVREPDETDTGTIAGALAIPLTDLISQPRLAGSGPVIVICEVTARAHRAAIALRAAGIEASVLAGGMENWRMQSLVDR